MQPGEQLSEHELTQAQVENILVTYCGACHGAPLTPQQALGGIWFIEDLDELTERGYIVPLLSAESRIVQVMRDGSMPPAASGLQRVSEYEIDVVARFIDEPLFWAVPQPRSMPQPRPMPEPALDAGVAPLPGDAGAD